MVGWLIRHAESVANFGGATDDPATTPLTDRGKEQARHLAAAIPRPPVLIVTSRYARTGMTAQPTLSRFPDVPHEVWPVEEFTYLPSLHGRLTTRAERRPIVEEYWARAAPSYVDGPGAESFAALLDRANGVLRRLREYGDRPVALFTHGVFMRAVLWALMTGPASPTADQMRLFRAFGEVFKIPNTAIFDLRLDVDGKSSIRGGTYAHLPADLVTDE
jgi:2,3-bisphosphoglycerate-dependent phosphoglycerate mutase